MSTAFWVLVIAGILILGYCVKKGAEKGLVEELNCILTLICAFIIFRIASSIAGRYTKGDISSVLVGAMLLVVVATAYGLPTPGAMRYPDPILCANCVSRSHPP